MNYDEQIKPGRYVLNSGTLTKEVEQPSGYTNAQIKEAGAR